jgi:hypothetical protein
MQRVNSLNKTSEDFDVPVPRERITQNSFLKEAEKEGQQFLKGSSSVMRRVPVLPNQRSFNDVKPN